MTPDEARARFQGESIARLATVGAGGRPHLVPIVFAIEGDAVYSAVDHKRKRSQRLKRLDNIRRNPQVAVLVDRYDDDWSRLWWVRADGTARVIEHGEEFDGAARILVRKYEEYARRPPAGPVIAIDIDAWSGWSAE